MKLLDVKTAEGRKAFIDKGYTVPEYDREQVKAATHDNPVWVHFGAGNIFRAFQAEIMEKLLRQGASDKGIIVAEGFDYEIIDRAYRPYDNLSLSVVMHSDGTIEKDVLGSVTESLKCDREFAEDWARLTEIFKNPSLQMVTMTITEKGYSFNEDDLNRGQSARFMMGKLTLLLIERYLAGGYPLTLQSTDNCSHNGDKIRAGVFAYADRFVSLGLVDPGFVDYVHNPAKITYPWSMIDKITPRPDPRIRAMLEKDGFEDLELIETARHSFTAPFVNAEEVGYLVIEEDYPAGHPALDKGGAKFTDRETVDKIERMKVGTCLNPLHTAISIYGCLLGFNLISAEMADADLKKLATRIGLEEGMPVVVNPGIIDPKQFIDEVLNKRFPNPFMPDTPQRISTDTSQKLSVRFGGTIREYMKAGLDVKKLNLIPLVFAGYARFLKAIDDEGNEMPLSSDPLLNELQPIVSGLEVKEGKQDMSCLKSLFSRKDVFGVDLYEVGLGEKAEKMAAELFNGAGAVRKTLHYYVNL